MRKVIVLMLALVVGSNFSLKAQSVIAFSYDNAGNVIQRKLTVMPPSQRPGFQSPLSHSEQKDSLNQIEFKVFPNPTNDLINIEGPLPEGVVDAKLYLINNGGQVMKSDIYNGTLKQVIVNDLKPGIYYLEVNYSKKHSSNYKIIITN